MKIMDTTWQYLDWRTPWVVTKQEATYWVVTKEEDALLHRCYCGWFIPWKPSRLVIEEWCWLCGDEVEEAAPWEFEYPYVELD